MIDGTAQHKFVLGCFEREGMDDDDDRERYNDKWYCHVD